ncbi:MAG TPA: isoprenylcysteine carboxylmethyltransferase family protein [Usitatibacter sp.]|jgi:protein-S-isoprenylcysteine O-methyltransferase Ste14|nr:isoprenylcysteine carboxylmethyltransferase family protein [Usitatibacter sp.]
MTTQSTRRSQVYVVLQFLLIAIYAAVFFLDDRVAWSLPPGVGWIGLALCAVALAIVFAALAAMGRVMQVSPEPKAGGHLVERGIYAYLRHPMYTGILLVVIGLFLRKPAIAVAIAGAALYVLLFLKARFEEQLLLQRYAGYAEYRKRTWGLIPGIR